MKTFLDVLKKYATLMAFGALGGTVLCLLIAPGILEWWATPDIPDTVCRCEKHVALAVGRMAKMQVYVAGAAAVVTATSGAVLSRLLKSRAAKPGQGAQPGEPGAAG